MTNLINIGLSGLNSYKLGLESVANNIANVNTEGYSRQVISYESQLAEKVRNGFIGSGVTIDDIERQTSDFNTRLMQENLSEYHFHKAFYDRAVVIDNLFALDGTDISDSLQSFFNSLEQLNESPGSIPARNVLIEDARFLTDQFNNIQNIIIESQNNLDQHIVDVTNEMTNLAESIANINNRILSVGSSPDLLDERDRLVLELSEYSSVQTTIQTNGLMDVSLGRGESLVLGVNYSTVTPGIDPDSGTTTISLDNGKVTYEITRNLLGGELAGLLEYEKNILDETSRQLGLVAIAFSENFNQQNNLGMDYNNEIGQNIFTDFNSPSLQLSRSVANPNNTAVPSAEISVNLSNISQLVSSDYTLEMTGALSATLTRLSDDTQISLTFSVPGAPPPDLQIATVDGSPATEVDGFELNITNAPAVGDKFFIRPTVNMAGHMEMLQENPEALALARPIRVYADYANQSDGSINIESITTTDLTAGNAPDLFDHFEIQIVEVNPAASPTNDFAYEIVNVTDGTTLAGGPFYADYDSAITIRDDVADTGYDVSITGPVKIGDVYHSEFNAGGIADNGNGLALSNIQQLGVINNGSETIFERYSSMIADLGTKTFYASVRRDSADVLFRQAEANKSSIVGVNLDEEASNLISLQQAYQASGQVIAVSKQLSEIIFSLLT
jgi:flagellar hook-associated protein 1 FlgK